VQAHQKRHLSFIRKKKLLERGIGIEIVVIDVTEHAIERPKGRQRGYYSGKKGKHALKSQVVANQQTGEIICTALGMGGVHDSNLYKQSNTPIQSETGALTDKGYLGIKKLHARSRHPKKKTKKDPLTKQEKKDNREINRERMVVEHINRKIKIFKIMTERYRNRRRRFGLRINLI